MLDVCYCHPSNLEYVKNLNFLHDLDIRFVADRCLPKTQTVEIWHPTAWGSYVDLSEDDEIWARPLGLGQITRQEQLVYYFMDSRKMNSFLSI